MTINYYCQGCVSSGLCFTFSHNDEGQCPCSICIIKPICQISCNKYKLFELKVLGHFKCPCSNCIFKPMCEIECDDFKLFEIGEL